MKAIKYLLIILLILCSFKLIPEEKIFSMSLRRTENLNEDDFIKSGNYVKVLYEQNNPVSGILFMNNKKHGELVFNKEGFLESFTQNNGKTNEQFNTNYIYQDNKLYKLKTSINDSIFVEVKIAYNDDDSMKSLEYNIKSSDKDISQTYTIEIKYENDLIIKKDSRANRYEKLYFIKSNFKIEYLDPIYYFMYKPFHDQDKIINKIEYFSNKNLIKTERFDKYGNIIE